MRRERVAKEPRKGGVLQKIVYAVVAIFIAAVWIYAFRSYFIHYDSTHPDIARAMPWVQTDVTDLHGVYLWNETVITSPRDGTVRYPRGMKPSRVGKGSVIARVRAGGTEYDIKAPEEGYFVPGVDGLEGSWRYSEIWLGEIPSAPPLEMRQDGAAARKGEPIGKIVPQPQELRFVGEAPASATLDRLLSNDTLMVRMDPLDSRSHAPVRVSVKSDGIVKFYLTIPWFPPEVLLAREGSIIAETGTTSGVTVPESAVTMRDGHTGVYAIRGSSAVFVEVTGRFVDGGLFLATDGLKLGDAVAVDGDNTVEGRVNIW